MNNDEIPQPAGPNHVMCYTINSLPHDYDLKCACASCYARTQNLIKNYWTSAPNVQHFTRRRLKKYRPYTYTF